jgi:hypothetical protein
LLLLLLLLVCQDLLTGRRWRRLGPLLLLAMLGCMALQSHCGTICNHRHHLLPLHLLILPACLALLWGKWLHTCISPDSSSRLLLQLLLVGKALQAIPRHDQQIHMTPSYSSSTLSS